MTYLLWLAFLAPVLAVLAVGLRYFDRTPHVISFRVSLAWTAFWAMLMLTFALIIHHVYDEQIWGFGAEPGYPKSGAEALSQFITAYVVETCMNLDNIFAMALIFAYFDIRLRYQYRVLYWGVLAALVVRALMIGGGLEILHRVHWANYLFGGMLLFSALRLLIARHDRVNANTNLLVYAAGKVLPATHEPYAGRFFLRKDGRLCMTPLFIALLLIESTDAVFAIDSIPASFAITQDPYLVYTSNIFAVLSMRSLYFALVALIDRFHYLRASLVVLLLFMSAKMFLLDAFPIAAPAALAVTLLIMSGGVAASARTARRKPEPLVGPLADELEEYARITWRQARKIVVLIVGSTLLLAGVAMLVLPGPAFVVIPAALAILATEFVWARRLLQRLKHEGEGVVKYLRHFRARKPKE